MGTYERGKVKSVERLVDVDDVDDVKLILRERLVEGGLLINRQIRVYADQPGCRENEAPKTG